MTNQTDKEQNATLLIDFDLRCHFHAGSILEFPVDTDLSQIDISDCDRLAESITSNLQTSLAKHIHDYLQSNYPTDHIDDQVYDRDKLLLGRLQMKVESPNSPISEQMKDEILMSLSEDT